MKKKVGSEIIFWLNVLEIAGIMLLLTLALAFQFLFGELPCPLCLLQRVGFLMVALGLLLNIRYGIYASHYAFTLLAALFTSLVALRQITLHVAPGDPGFGSKILGLHMYSWSFILCMLIVAYTATILGFHSQYKSPQPKGNSLVTGQHPMIFYIVFTLLLILIGANFISVLLTCGLSACPDIPLSGMTVQTLK